MSWKPTRRRHSGPHKHCIIIKTCAPLQRRPPVTNLFFREGSPVFVQGYCRRNNERCEYPSHFVSRFPSAGRNIAFMIGRQYLGHWKDVLSDNLGSWKNDGKKTLHYSTFHKVSKQIKLNPSPEKQANAIVSRYFYVYPKTPLFKRIVVTVSNHGKQQIVGYGAVGLEITGFCTILFRGWKKTDCCTGTWNFEKAETLFLSKKEQNYESKKGYRTRKMRDASRKPYFHTWWKKGVA